MTHALPTAVLPPCTGLPHPLSLPSLEPLIGRWPCSPRSPPRGWRRLSISLRAVRKQQRPRLLALATVANRPLQQGGRRVRCRWAISTQHPHRRSLLSVTVRPPSAPRTGCEAARGRGGPPAQGASGADGVVQTLLRVLLLVWAHRARAWCSGTGTRPSATASTCSRCAQRMSVAQP